MSDSTSSSTGGVCWVQFAGILIAATVLGLIYNSASPLRVHEIEAGEINALTAATVAVKPAIVRTGVHNQTISMTLETPAVLSPPATTKNNPTPPTATTPAIPSLKWPEVKAQLDAGRIVLVDARLKANYDIGHIPGAILLPATSSAEELRAFAEKYPKSTAFVTYCGSDSCHMSHQLAEALIKICGFTHVSNMPGGYAEYTIANAAAK